MTSNGTRMWTLFVLLALIAGSLPAASAILRPEAGNLLVSNNFAQNADGCAGDATAVYHSLPSDLAHAVLLEVSEACAVTVKWGQAAGRPVYHVGTHVIAARYGAELTEYAPSKPTLVGSFSSTGGCSTTPVSASSTADWPWIKVGEPIAITESSPLCRAAWAQEFDWGPDVTNSYDYWIETNLYSSSQAVCTWRIIVWDGTPHSEKRLSCTHAGDNLPVAVVYVTLGTVLPGQSVEYDP